jgi:lipopolysaccharide transport system permease protein
MAEPRIAFASAGGAATPVAQHELIIEGGPGRLRLSSIKELWEFREVFSAFVTRLVKVRYKQAAVGVGWSIVQPVISAGLFAIFLGRLSHIASEGVPYLLFALTGTVTWTYFSGAAGNAMESLISDQVLLRKVYFPREILPFAAVVAALVDLVPGLLTVAVASMLYGLTPSLYWLLLPVPVVLLFLTASALGLAVSALNVYYRDVRYALPFVLQLGLFASPVVYSLSIVPSTWRTVYAIFNPVAAAIDAVRRIMLHDTAPQFTVTLGAFVFATFALILSYSLFKRLERGFADRV